MTYFNSTDEELLATGEYSNFMVYAEGIWFDQRTGELMTRDKMIWERLTYWYRCYKHILEQRAGRVWKWEKPSHRYKYKHRNSVKQTAKLMGLHLKIVESLNKLYQECDSEGKGTLATARKTLGRNWKRAIRNLEGKNLIKVNGDTISINPSFILTRDNWPTASKREALLSKYEDAA